MKKEILKMKISPHLLLSMFLFFGCSIPENKSHTEEAPKETHMHSVDTVTIRQMQFNPAELKVNKGDTVVWINKDLVDHNITEEKSKSWFSDTLRVGKSWKMAVTDSAGYYCTIHPTMKGRLILK